MVGQEEMKFRLVWDAVYFEIYCQGGDKVGQRLSIEYHEIPYKTYELGQVQYPRRERNWKSS